MWTGSERGRTPGFGVGVRGTSKTPPTPSSLPTQTLDGLSVSTVYTCTRESGPDRSQGKRPSAKPNPDPLPLPSWSPSVGGTAWGPCLRPVSVGLVLHRGWTKRVRYFYLGDPHTTPKCHQDRVASELRSHLIESPSSSGQDSSAYLSRVSVIQVLVARNNPETLL